MPPVCVTALNRPDKALVETAVTPVEGCEIFLHERALGVSVGGAGAFDDGETGTTDKGFYILFVCVDEGAYHNEILFREIRYGRKRAEAPLKKQIQHKCFRRIVEVMPESKLVAGARLDGVVEHTAPHARAQGAGIFFAANIEDYAGDLGAMDVKRNAQPPAKLPDLGKIGLGRCCLGQMKAHIHHNGTELKMLGVELSELRESTKKGKGVLSAGYTDRDAISLMNHIVFLNRISDTAQKFLHFFHKIPQWHLPPQCHILSMNIE